MWKRGIVCGLVALAASLVVSAQAADLVVLTEKTWDEFAPQGKEVDCIYGDYVVRNDKLVAVIAQPIAGRNANMTVKDVAGGIIDLTVVGQQSDQLSAYYPGGKQMAWRAGPAVEEVRNAKSVSLTFRSESAKGRPNAELKYTLEDGNSWILVETTYTNLGSDTLEVTFVDDVRADKTFEKVPNGKGPIFWAYDPWFGQAYGILPVLRGNLECSTAGNSSSIKYAPDLSTTAKLVTRMQTSFARRIFPGRTLLDVQAVAGDLAGWKQETFAVVVRDSAGVPVGDAEVTIETNDPKNTPKVSGKTDAQGRLAFRRPGNRTYTAEIRTLGQGTTKLELKPGDNIVEVPAAGRVSARITDANGGPIPCKVQFRGQGETKDPFFGPDSGEHALHNLYYSHNGQFEQILPPGQYEAIVSHGPEYDAVFTPIEIRAGEKTPLKATLKRTVNTKGWISADFHNHASPSGDNTTSQFGRVLNLLCEQIEFAPCTEHNRISTYAPHIERLKAERLIGTCTGIELTGTPLPVNHQNAFPMVMKPRTQDNGGPLSDVDAEVQIARLALWDNRSEKLVQQNHPDIGLVFFDKNADGQPDGGLASGIPHMDVMEVHPLQAIFKPALLGSKEKPSNNRIVNWLQLLNQGHRIPGTVCTDAHYNFHGSGPLRVYVQSPTDEPGDVKTLDVVHAAEQGRMTMTNGPFLEVAVDLPGAQPKQTVTAGQDLVATSGKVDVRVRVECPNWFDINRVQIVVNGRMPQELNCTRESHADHFGSGNVKFERTIPVELKEDAHLIVVAAGEKLTMGPVMGPEHGKEMPIAVSNPIFVDVDGGGFKANGDTLDASLPVAGPGK